MLFVVNDVHPFHRNDLRIACLPPPKGFSRAETPRRGGPESFFSATQPLRARFFPVLAANGSTDMSRRISPPQRQRRCAIEPGVVRVAALPRVQAAARSLPRKGLCRSCPSGGCDIKGRNGMGFACADAETFQQELPGYTIPKKPIPPVRSFGTTLSGLLICWGCTQGSASAAQPWALWQNPVGIPGGGNARAHTPPGIPDRGKAAGSPCHDGVTIFAKAVKRFTHENLRWEFLAPHKTYASECPFTEGGLSRREAETQRIQMPSLRASAPE